MRIREAVEKWRAGWSLFFALLALHLCAMAQGEAGNCSSPIPVTPPASFSLNPCSYTDSTASDHKDAVMLIGPSNTSREVTVYTSGADTMLFVYTSCPDSTSGSSRIARDDNSGPGSGSKVTFNAASWASYYVVLEPDRSPACGNTSISFDVKELPDQGSCGSPIHLDPPDSLILNPCTLWDHTASSSSDAVMLIGASDTERQLTVISSGTDTKLYVFTQCPDSAGGSSQVASNNDGGPNDGSKVVFTAAAHTSYFVVLEPHESWDCGDARVDVFGPPPSGTGSCSDPLSVDPLAFFALNPCNYGDSTSSSNDDAVMLIGSSSTPRVITVETLGADTRLFAYTLCPDTEDGSSKVIDNDGGGPGSGSRIVFAAQANVSYFIVLEPDYTSACGMVGIFIDASELPSQRGSCSDPIPVEPPVSLTSVWPCALEDSAATSSKDAVMLINSSDSLRVITIEVFSSDAALYIFTSCPDEVHGSSQVPYDELDSSGSGSKLSFAARASTPYYVVLEDDSGSCSVSSVAFNVTETLDASELPREEGSCSFPILVDPPASFSLDPCSYTDSTASDRKDAVMLIGPSNSSKEITVETSGKDTELNVYTFCPDSTSGSTRIAHNDDGGPWLGSKVTFNAAFWESYYVVLEPDYSSDCGNASITFNATELPDQGSCGSPIRLDPPASLVLNPCTLWDHTASSNRDVVMLLDASNTPRSSEGVTIIASGLDTKVYVFTQCPDSAGGSSQVAHDDDDGPNTGSKVVFYPEPSTQYYVVLEPDSSSSCGDATVDVLLRPPEGAGLCSDPISVDPPAFFALNPCAYNESTATSNDDAVMFVGPSSTPRVITVETSGGADTKLFAYTACPDIDDGPSQVAENDAGGLSYGSKIVFNAQADVPYFVVLEPDYPDACETVGIHFDAFELPWQSASCSDPIPVEPPASLTDVWPCAYEDSTGSPSKDAVMLISPSDTAREITVTSSQIDTELYVYTRCPESEDGPSQIADDDDGGPGTGSQVTFFAEASTAYYVILEAYSSSACGNASVTFGVTELPERGSTEASCTNPIPLTLDPSTSLEVDPCAYDDSTGSSNDDAVMFIAPSDSAREIVIVTTGTDTELYVMTQCPDSTGGPSQVAYDDDSGSDAGSKIVFTAEPSTQYYVVLEPYSLSDCGNATVDVTEAPGSTELPPSFQEACGESVDPVPQIVNLDQFGDFYTASFDSCSGKVAKLAPIGRQRTIRVAVTPEQEGVSSDFFVSEFCLQAQSGRSTVDITQDSDSKTFVAASDEAFFIALNGDESTCGPVKLYIEFVNILVSGQQQAGCTLGGSLSPLALNDTGKIVFNDINTCDQESSSNGALANYDLGRRKDFVIPLAPSPASAREIQVTVEDASTRPILLASDTCTGHTQDNMLAWFDPSQSSDSASLTFIASAGVPLYIVLESPEEGQCGPQGNVLISCLSAEPSMPRLGRSGTKKIGIELKVDTDFNELTRTSERIRAFKKEVTESLAYALHALNSKLLEREDSQEVCLSCVTIGDLSRGSVVAPITVLLRDDEQEDQVKEFARQINDVETSSLIQGSSYEDKALGHSVSEPEDASSPPGGVETPGQTNNPDDGSGGPKASVIGPAVGVPVGVVFIVILSIPLIYWARKHRHREHSSIWVPPARASSDSTWVPPARGFSDFGHVWVPPSPPSGSPRGGPAAPERRAVPPPLRTPSSPPSLPAPVIPPPLRTPPSPPRSPPALPPQPSPRPAQPAPPPQLSTWQEPPPQPAPIAPIAPTEPAAPTAPSWPELAEASYPPLPQSEPPMTSTFQPASLPDLPPTRYPHHMDNPMHTGIPAPDPTVHPLQPPASSAPGLVDNPLGEEEAPLQQQPSPLPEIQQNQPLPGEECLVCLEGPRQFGFLHSGTLHLGVCQECSRHIRPGSACMVCRGTIEHIIRVHS